MIQVVLERYESYYGVGVDVDLLLECVVFVKCYVKECCLLDVVIDLIDCIFFVVKMINQSGEKDIKGLVEQFVVIEVVEDQFEVECMEKLWLVNFIMKNWLSFIFLGMFFDGQNELELLDYGEWMDYILGVFD